MIITYLRGNPILNSSQNPTPLQNIYKKIILKWNKSKSKERTEIEGGNEKFLATRTHAQQNTDTRVIPPAVSRTREKKKQ